MKPALLLCLILLQTGFDPRPSFCAGEPKQGLVLVQNLNMRAGPGRHHPVIARLNKGVRILVLSYEGDWVRVSFEEQTGFVMNTENFIFIDETGGREPAMLQEMKEKQTNAIQKQLSVSMEKIAAFSREEAAVIDELDRLEMDLSQSRQQVARLNADLTAVEHRIDELESDIRELENQIEINEGYVAERLTALYKLSWMGKFHVLASSNSIADFFVTKRHLEQVLSHDEKVTDKLAGDLSRLNDLMGQLVAKKKEKQITAAELGERIIVMKAQQSERETLLVGIRNKKSLQLAAAEALKRSARDLDGAVASFSLDSEKKAPIEVKEKPFASLKGLLMMPVKGTVTSFFGHYQDNKFNVTHFQSGIHIRAEKGEPIRAVHSGRTLYASWFKGFGNMLIVDHGDHYYTVYAHLEETFKSKGDSVEAGEVIATVGATGSLTEAGLHFEVRHHGKPMNPMDWIKKG